MQASLPFAVALALPSVAHAGRIERFCGEAPRTVLDEEVSRQIDVDLAARVTGTPVDGEVGGASAKQVKSVSLLTTDATARDVALYRLCTQYVNGLIEPQQYDEERRYLLGMTEGKNDPKTSRRSAESGEAPGDTSARPDVISLAPQALLGTWKVVGTYRSGTCTSLEKSALYYLWDVVPSADGGVQVQVRGTTVFPKLSGKFEGVALTIAGQRDGGSLDADSLVGHHWTSADGYFDFYAVDTVSFSLNAVSDTMLVGERTLVYINRKPKVASGSTAQWIDSCAQIHDIIVEKNQ